MSARLLIWVQHLLGVGHLARAGAIADACLDRGFEVVLASGGPPAPEVMPRRARFVQLAPLKAADETFSALTDERGNAPADALLSARREALLALHDEFSPHIVVTESFPCGRRRFAFELEPLLDRAREGRALVVASVRDILVPFVKRRHEQEALARLALHYGAVLVHGDEALVPLEASAPWIRESRVPLHYTGYVLRPLPAPAAESGEILVSAGGGAAGAALFRAAIAAARLVCEFPWRLVGGPALDSAAFAGLAASAPPNLTVEKSRDGLALLMGQAKTCVMQAGYNSVAEGLFMRARMVLVPFETPRETEQASRARILSGLGLAALLPQDRLNPESLAHAVRESAARERPRPQIALDGALQTGKILQTLLARHGRT